MELRLSYRGEVTLLDREGLAKIIKDPGKRGGLESLLRHLQRDMYRMGLENLYSDRDSRSVVQHFVEELRQQGKERAVAISELHAMGFSYVDAKHLYESDEDMVNFVMRGVDGLRGFVKI
jgi:hypothetical protein